MIYGKREVLIEFKEPENIFVESAKKKNGYTNAVAIYSLQKQPLSILTTNFCYFT